MKPEEYTGEKISSGKYRVLMEELKWTNYFKVDNNNIHFVFLANPNYNYNK